LSTVHVVTFRPVEREKNSVGPRFILGPFGLIFNNSGKLTDSDDKMLHNFCSANVIVRNTIYVSAEFLKLGTANH